jgi:hypothetical protein
MKGMTRAEKMQALFHLYQSETEHKPATLREVIEWGVNQGMLKLPKSDPLDILAPLSRQSRRSRIKRRHSAHPLGDHGIRAA